MLRDFRIEPILRFGAKRPLFWKLEVNFDLRGFNFKQTYLVPRYDANAAAGSK